MDEAEVRRVQADCVVAKPFQASVLLDAVKPLVASAGKERGSRPAGSKTASGSAKRPTPKTPVVALIDPERVRAAVTVALDASLSHGMIDEITEKVLIALSNR